jgi:UDP-glucose 4-epimerase
LVRERLGWRPTLDNLDTIVGHALAWEDSLARRNLRY